MASNPVMKSIVPVDIVSQNWACRQRKKSIKFTNKALEQKIR
jgi:hypothetical protein